MTRSFALTYDYRCPWGRIVHDHVYWGLKGGADWLVEFTPFCLGQPDLDELKSDIWDRPEDDSGIVALQASIAVRDTQPDKFLEMHHALYEYRHTSNGNLRNREPLTAIVAQYGVDTDSMWIEVDSGRPLATIKAEHTGCVTSHSVWGVPTFIVGASAVFTRLMTGPNKDFGVSAQTINRILDNIDWPALNEFKHTTVAL